MSFFFQARDISCAQVLDAVVLSEYIVTPNDWPTGVEFTAADLDSNGTLNVFVRHHESKRRKYV